MIKKLSILGLCGVSLMGLTGCGLTTQNEEYVEEPVVDSVVTQEESDQIYYLMYDGWGITPKTLFDAMNQVDPELKLDESMFDAYVHTETGEKTFFASPVEKVLIDYRVVQTDAGYNLEDESLVGMLLDGLYIHYDQTDEVATKYATDLLNAFQSDKLMLDEYLSEAKVLKEAFEPGTLRGYPIEEVDELYASHLANFEQIAAISIY